MSSAFLEEAYQKAIDAEVDKRSSTLNNLEDTARQYQREISAYEELRARLQTLSAASKELYGFRSPFRTFIGSSDGIPEYFTVTANRKAYDTTHDIEVIQIAQSQKFSSKAFNMKDELPAGTLIIKIGDEEKTVTFEGGSLLQFQKTLSKVLGRDVKTMITQKSKNLQVLTIDLVATGADNSMEVISDDAGIFTALNMFTRRNFRYLGHTFNETLIGKWKDLSDNMTTNYLVKNDFLILNGENKLLIPLDREAEGGNPIAISFSVRMAEKGSELIEEPILSPNSEILLPDSGVLFEEIDNLTFEDIELYGEGLSPSENTKTFEEIKKQNEELEALSQTNNMSPAQTNEAPNVDDGLFNSNLVGVRYIDSDGNEKEEFFTVENVNANWQEINLIITDSFKEGDVILDAMLINENKNYDIYYKDIIIEDIVKQEDVANFSIQDAKDARISVNGVDILKEDNNFEDILDGITVVAKKPTVESMSVTIKADEEKVVAAIVDFIRAYNEMIDFLNDTTKRPLPRDTRDELEDMNRVELIDLATALDIEYDDEMSDDFLKKKLYYVGVFTGNASVSSISQKMRSIIITSYPTMYENELALLTQIGISRGGAGESWEIVKKGFLQVDEELFLAKLETQIDGIQELFANDVTGDSVPDTGIAYSIEEAIRPYAQLRGVVDNSIASSKAKLESNGKLVESEKDRVDNYRASRTEAYYKMQSELKNAESESKRLDSMQNAGNNR